MKTSRWTPIAVLLAAALLGSAGPTPAFALRQRNAGMEESPANRGLRKAFGVTRPSADGLEEGENENGSRSYTFNESYYRYLEQRQMEPTTVDGPDGDGLGHDMFGLPEWMAFQRSKLAGLEERAAEFFRGVMANQSRWLWATVEGDFDVEGSVASRYWNAPRLNWTPE